MPRTAATIVGLVLVACSIGFNTSRYPIVWRMTGPSAVTASEPAAAPPTTPASDKPTEPAKPAEPVKPVEPVKPIEPVKPVEPIKEKPVAPVPPAKEEAKLSPDAKDKKDATAKPSPKPQADQPKVDQPKAKRFSLVSTQSDKPLTPVPRVISVERMLGEPDPAASVCRLPPVDPNVPSPARDTSPLPGGAIPIYPRTGI